MSIRSSIMILSSAAEHRFLDSDELAIMDDGELEKLIQEAEQEQVSVDLGYLNEADFRLLELTEERHRRKRLDGAYRMILEAVKDLDGVRRASDDDDRLRATDKVLEAVRRWMNEI